MAIAAHGRSARSAGLIARLAGRSLAQAYRNLANLLTISRIFLVVPLVVMLEREAYTAAFWVFLVAALSDIADGFVAKRMNGCTSFGAALDPAADKLLIGAMFLVLGAQGSVPIPLVVLVIGRDVLLVGGAALLRYRLRSFRIEPRVVGKICTFLQLTLLGFVLGRLGDIADAAPVIEILVPLVAVFTAVSALAYVGAGLRLEATGERREHP